MYDLTQRIKEDPEMDVCLVYFILFYLVWFGLVCVISVLPVLVAWGGFVQIPFQTGSVNWVKPESS